jgi:hypothetical protein
MSKPKFDRTQNEDTWLSMGRAMDTRRASWKDLAVILSSILLEGPNNAGDAQWT